MFLVVDALSWRTKMWIDSFMIYTSKFRPGISTADRLDRAKK